MVGLSEPKLNMGDQTECLEPQRWKRVCAAIGAEPWWRTNGSVFNMEDQTECLKTRGEGVCISVYSSAFDDRMLTSVHLHYNCGNVGVAGNW